jgi:hypothetical protein
MAKNQHVIKRSDGWAIRGAGNTRDTVRGIATQKAAEKRAIPLAKRQRGDVIIHRADNGRFGRRNSYGNDPFPPRG